MWWSNSLQMRNEICALLCVNTALFHEKVCSHHLTYHRSASPRATGRGTGISGEAALPPSPAQPLSSPRAHPKDEITRREHKPPRHRGGSSKQSLPPLLFKMKMNDVTHGTPNQLLLFQSRCSLLSFRGNRSRMLSLPWCVGRLLLVWQLASNWLSLWTSTSSGLLVDAATVKLWNQPIRHTSSSWTIAITLFVKSWSRPLFIFSQQIILNQNQRCMPSYHGKVERRSTTNYSHSLIYIVPFKGSHFHIIRLLFWRLLKYAWEHIQFNRRLQPFSCAYSCKRFCMDCEAVA